MRPPAHVRGVNVQPFADNGPCFARCIPSPTKSPKYNDALSAFGSKGSTHQQSSLWDIWAGMHDMHAEGCAWVTVVCSHACMQLQAGQADNRKQPHSTHSHR